LSTSVELIGEQARSDDGGRGVREAAAELGVRYRGCGVAPSGISAFLTPSGRR
jgi:hypothetical protein